MHDTPEAATVYSPRQNSASPILPEGYLLRDYKIIKMLGHGGFGITYLAQEDITDKLVVIKENYPTTVSFRDMASLTVGPLTDKHKETYDWALTRFLDEAKTLSRLSHPNIVPILAAFKALGTAYYVMPHVEGTELHKAAPAPDSLTAEWFLPVLEKILSALDYLHSQGLIHRDIKPNNILLRADGEPILIDFGTARALESTHSHTHIGTPGFMPFEQLSARGKRGPWTDFYALGATCYYLITGELPPHSVDRMEEDEYLPLAGNPSLAGRFPEHVLSSIDKALRMNRSERWQSAQEWLDALKTQQSVASAPVQTAPQTPPTPVKQVQPEIIQPTLTREQAQQRLASLGIYSREYNNTLLSAAEKGEAHLITLLLAAGADVNVADDFGWTPLIRAARNGHKECVRLLLAAPGIDVNMAAEYGATPLLWAALNGHKECVRLLLAAPGIDVNKGAPLNAAAENGHTDCVRLLLAAPGINVNKGAPLNAAAANGHTDCVRLLLAAPEIDVNQPKWSGETPLSEAANKNHTECMRLLLAAPGIDVNKANHNGWTPLHWAAYKGQKECVRLLLAAPKIDLNKENQLGRTPLYWAVENNHTECAELIRAAGETVHSSLTSEQAQEELKRLGIYSWEYDDTLRSAAEKGEAHLITLLLSAGADVNGADDYGWTPLIWAVKNDDTKCLKLLLDAPRIEINKTDKYGDTPLYWAAYKGQKECVRLLLVTPGIDVNKGDEDGNTPLSIAADNGHTDCVRLLLAAPGIDVNKDTPLSWAASRGHTECVNLLLNAPGININQADSYGDTPLFKAAACGHTECVRLLLAVPGIDVNKADHNGWPPLHWAAYKGQIECVRLLLAAPGIDINKASSNGKTPLYWAERNNHTECARLIREAGGRR